MAGIESRYEIPRHLEIPLPLRRLREYSDQIADYRELDEFATYALARFALINFRVRDIVTDFRGTTQKRAAYLLNIDEEGLREIAVVSRDKYPNMLRSLSTTAFNLYNKYLSGSENTRAAAREVQDIVTDLFPPRI